MLAEASAISTSVARPAIQEGHVFDIEQKLLELLAPLIETPPDPKKVDQGEQYKASTQAILRPMKNIYQTKQHKAFTLEDMILGAMPQRLAPQERTLLHMIANTGNEDLAVEVNAMGSGGDLGRFISDPTDSTDKGFITLSKKRWAPYLKQNPFYLGDAEQPMSARDSAFVLAHEYGHKIQGLARTKGNPLIKKPNKGEEGLLEVNYQRDASEIGGYLLRLLEGKTDPRRGSRDMEIWNTLAPILQGK